MVIHYLFHTDAVWSSSDCVNSGDSSLTSLYCKVQCVVNGATKIREVADCWHKKLDRAGQLREDFRMAEDRLKWRVLACQLSVVDESWWWWWWQSPLFGLLYILPWMLFAVHISKIVTCCDLMCDVVECRALRMLASLQQECCIRWYAFTLFSCQVSLHCDCEHYNGWIL